MRTVQRDPLRPRRPVSPRDRTARPTTARPVRAGWSSGTWSSWSSTSGPMAACRCRSRASTRAWAWNGWPASSSRSRGPSTRTCSHPSTSGCASCSVTTPRHSRRSGSATRSSPTTRGRSPSSSPTTSCRPTRAAVTCCAASSAGLSVTDGSSDASEPFLTDLAAVVIETMGEAYPHLVARQPEIVAAIAREEAQFARTLDAGTVHLDEALSSLATTERAIGRSPDDLPADAPAARRRHRVPAARHLRVPGGPDGGARRRVRRRGRPAGVRAGAGRAARPLAVRQEGRARRSTRSSPRSTAPSRPVRRHRVPRIRHHDRRGPGRRDPARRASSTTS